MDKKGHYIFLGHNLMISVTVLAHCAPAHALVSRLVRWLCSAKLSASQRAQPSLNTVGFSRISLRVEILLYFTVNYNIVKDSNADLTKGKLRVQNRPIISNSSGLV